MDDEKKEDTKKAQMDSEQFVRQRIQRRISSLKEREIMEIATLPKKNDKNANTKR